MKVKKVVLQFLCSVLFGCFLILPVLADEAPTAEENKNIQGTLMMTAAFRQCGSDGRIASGDACTGYRAERGRMV